MHMLKKHIKSYKENKYARKLNIKCYHVEKIYMNHMHKTNTHENLKKNKIMKIKKK